MSEREQKPASLWVDKSEPALDVLEDVVAAKTEPPSLECTDAAKAQREMFRETDFTDLATYLVR